MLKSLEKIVKEYDVISFDIFDTLIKRIVSTPSEVFYLVAKKYKETVNNNADIEELYNLRIASEKNARLRNKTEISLDDIYSEFPNMYDINSLKELEISAELEVCFANNEMVDILNYCYSLGKKIVITSDMYMNYNTISLILKKNGIYFDDLFISSEFKATKSNGKLFEILLKKYDNKKIIHIGDNIKSDYISPMKLGISAFKYKTKKTTKQSARKIYLDNIVNKKSFENIYYQYGYKYLGPLMYGFSENLFKSSIENDKLIFFAREGKFMKECFDVFCNHERETKYMYVSRKSVTKYCMSKFKTFKELKSNISFSRNEDVKTFLKRVSLYNEDVLNMLEENGIGLEYSFYNDNVQMFFDKHYSSFKKYSDSIFDNYIKEIGINRNSCIVDIGWAGSMQDLLEKYFGYNINGYYMGVRSVRKNKYKHGYVYDGEDYIKEMKSRNFNGLFEILMAADHGTTIDYQKDDGKVVPVLLENDVSDKIMELISEIQSGAIQFINDFKNLSFKYDFSNYDYYKDFFETSYRPNKQILEMFSDFSVYDEKNYKLVENKGFFYYITHPKIFIRDYKESGWKSAFMKINFGFYFNELYCILYKLDKKGEKK